MNDSIYDNHGDNDDVYAHGVRVYWKPDRKQTNHQAASVDVDEDIINEFSTTKTTTAWVKVTKAANVDIKPFTTYGDDVFTIVLDK